QAVRMQWFGHQPSFGWALNATEWNILWGVLAGLSVLLVVLLRTRWARTRPWRKCALLSLWVHILLAFAATTVRVVVGAPETGDGEPIRVTVQMVADETVEHEKEELTPAWEQLAVPSLIPPQA